MPVRYGPARITFSGDEARAQDYLDQALHLLRNTEERARLGNLDVLGSQWRLDDDSYCYAIIAGGISAVHIVAGPVEAEVASEAKGTDLPDFLSGVIHNGYLEKTGKEGQPGSGDTLSEFKPTLRAARDYKLPHSYQTMQRLAVEPWREFAQDLRNPSTLSRIRFSQYVRLKPTNYSGTMVPLVQLLMGFGKQRADKEGEPQTRYSKYPRDRNERVPAVPGQYAQDVAKHGLQIRYDWRFSRTHGLTRAADGTWWLVEIGITQGVVAFPLLLHPPTATSRFRDWIRDKLGDTDGLTVLDTFGGFPTGEGMPSGQAAAAWERAGRLLRIADKDALQPFYEASSYSSEMGWAFNASGSEAHNTAWYQASDGIQRGVHYVCTMRVGASSEVTRKRTLDGLRAKMAQRRSEFPEVLDAVLWKLDRLSNRQLFEVQSLLPNVDAAIRRADSFELSPIATCGGTVTRAGIGYLHNNAKIDGVMRFPERALGLLLSHKMRSGWGNVGADKLCDTVVHVFFQGERLKWVRYFRDPRTSPAQHRDDFEQCMYIGSWSSHDETGERAQGPSFYSTDFDDRAEHAATVTDTKIKGWDLGYSALDVSDDPLYPVVGNATREKRFKKRIEATTVYAPSVGSSMAVPFYNREAYFYSVVHADDGRVHSVQWKFEYLRDPWSCNYWRNFPGYTGHYVGDIGSGHWVRLAQHPDGCGPVTDRTAASPSPNYGAFACSDLADSGPWCQVCDDIDTMTYHIPAPPLPDFVSETLPPESNWQVWLVDRSGLAPIMTDHGTGPWGLWHLHSPFDGDPNTSWDEYIDATCNVFGAATSLGASKNLNASKIVKGQPHWPEMETGGLTYIGVIDSG